MQKNHNAAALIIAILALAALSGSAPAQEGPPLRLRLIRTFGYGGFNQIEGNFNLRLSDPPPLERVEFLVDGEVVHTATGALFEYRFHTSEFQPGVHTMTALGYSEAGEVLTSNSITQEFLTAEGARQETVGLLLPLFALIFGLMAAGTVLTVILARRRGYAVGQYGFAGGAVCPRCSLPYSRHLLAPNLLAGKLERCPHCGKWALVRRASPGELREAESRLREGSISSPASGLSDEERLRRMLDESRYEE